MSTSTGETPRKWWQSAIVYQIYPSSFKDSNGDGLGDLPGIISKVDYLKALGADAIWLSPCFKSPQVDMGYDISDYREIHRPYGTLEDAERLIAELKKRNIRLLMDLVVNHTSDEHPWFIESKSSLTNPKRDWYIWRKGKIGPNGEKLPPNNWESIFKGSAWEYDANTDEYYFHLFATAQPDLNWENPEVREAIQEDMHFWLQKGLGGFRMDAINHISKDPSFPDAEKVQEGPYQPMGTYVRNRPPVHEWLRELREKVFDKYEDLVIIGECGGTHDVEDIRKYVDPDRHELDMAFQFEVTEIDKGLTTFSAGDFSLPDLKRITSKWQNVLRPAWNTFHLENHDGGRSVNRFGFTNEPKYFPAVSKLLAVYMMTLGGTIFLHQGQEIGAKNLMEDIDLQEYKDMATHSEYNMLRGWRVQAAGHEDVDMSDVMKEVLLKARDHGRVPMAWDSSEGAGFTTGKPWMTFNSDYEEVNVEAQEKDKNSVLATWREMIALRKQHPEELVYGRFELLDPDHKQIFAYRRRAKAGNAFLIVLNWSDKPAKWKIEADKPLHALKTVGKVQESGGQLEMDPYACICWST